MIKAIFLDKDGTIIPDIPYNVKPELITLQPGVIAGLKLLADQGFRFFVISNQSGVARGYFEEKDLLPVEQKLQELFNVEGLQIDDFYWSYNHPQGSVKKYAVTCNMRKPQPGMLFLAAQNHQIDLKNSWMIGDILNDAEAGNRAGCQTALINNGNETEWLEGEFRQPTYTAKNFLQAAEFIADVHSTDTGI